jgi:hypothetical protein
MSRKKLDLTYSFILKLNKEDRQLLDFLQDNGINMSGEFRQFLRKKAKETHETNIQ